MDIVIDAFRECWGKQRPSKRQLRQRMQQLGYSHAMLQKIANVWWSALGSSAELDWPLYLSQQVSGAGMTLIVSEQPVSLLLVWREGELCRLERGSIAQLTALADAEAERNNNSESLQRCIYQVSTPLAENWQTAAELSLSQPGTAMMTMDTLGQLPAYRQRRHRILLIAGSLALLLVILIALWHWFIDVGDAASSVKTALTKADKAAVKRVSYLPATQVLQQLAQQTQRQWHGAWQLQQVRLQGRELVSTFNGHGVLALLQQPPPGSTKKGQHHVRGLLLVEQHELSAEQAVTRLTQLYDYLRRQFIPGLRTEFNGQHLDLHWQGWSSRHIHQLSQLLGQRLTARLDTVVAESTANAQGRWSGQIRLQSAPAVATQSSTQENANE